MCPRCQRKHSNRRNCDGTKRTLDERIVGQQERLAAVKVDHAEGAAEALLRIGPQNIRSARWNKGGVCQLCRQPARNTRIVTIPAPGSIGIYIVHDHCAMGLFREVEASAKRDEAAMMLRVKGIDGKWRNGFGDEVGWNDDNEDDE